MLYIENPKDATKILLELNNEFGKVAGYKINTRNLLHFYTLTMKDQKERTSLVAQWLRIRLPMQGTRV